MTKRWVSRQTVRYIAVVAGVYLVEMAGILCWLAEPPVPWIGVLMVLGVLMMFSLVMAIFGTVAIMLRYPNLGGAKFFGPTVMHVMMMGLLLMAAVFS